MSSRLAVLAGLSLSSLATCLSAQTLPVPTLPTSVQAPTRPPPWEYALGIGVGWDSNVDFLSQGSPSSALLQPTARLARVFASTQGEVRASAGGQWVGYVGPEVQKRPYLDTGLRGDYRLSTTTRLGGDARYELGYTDSSSTLADQGVLLPLVKTQTLSAELYLTQSLGSRTSLRLDGRALRNGFDQPGFIDSASQRGSATLERKMSVRDAAGLAYAFEHTLMDPQQGSLFTHFGSLQWTRTLSKFSALLLEAGASYAPQAAEGSLGRSESFYGGFTFARRTRSSNLVAYLRREVAPAFGLGASRLETRVGLQAEVPIGRSRLRLLGSHVQPSSGEGAEVLFAPSSEVALEVSHRLSRRSAVSAQARYRRRGGTAALGPVSGFQALVSVTFASEAS